MVILLHVSAALASLVYGSLLLWRPREVSFYPAYGLVGLTLGSGTYLTISRQVNLLRVCLTGLLYLGVVSLLIIFAHRRASATAKAG